MFTAEVPVPLTYVTIKRTTQQKFMESYQYGIASVTETPMHALHDMRKFMNSIRMTSDRKEKKTI